MTIATNVQIAKLTRMYTSRKLKKVHMEISRKVIGMLKKIELSSPHEI